MTAPERSRDVMVPSRPWDIFFRLAPWLGVLGLAAWTRWPGVGWLAFSSVSSLSVFFARPRRGVAHAVAGIVVLAGVVAENAERASRYRVAPGQMSEQERRRLEALGYVQGRDRELNSGDQQSD